MNNVLTVISCAGCDLPVNLDSCHTIDYDHFGEHNTREICETCYNETPELSSADGIDLNELSRLLENLENE